MSTLGAPPPPSLPLSQARPLLFVPSLLPRNAPPAGANADLRDVHAEEAQQQQVWTVCEADLGLLLRLPLAEFLSHCLYNKSLQRLIENALQQLPTLWEDASGIPYTQRWWSTRDELEEEDESKADSKPARSSPLSRGTTEQIKLLRAIAKRVLLIYVRLCTTQLLPANGDGTPTTAASSAQLSPTLPWLTTLFFTTSFSASPLFTPAQLIDLVAFYSSVSRKAHHPLLVVVMNRVAASLPYAFGHGMQQAVGVLLGALHAQCKLVHAPYAAGSGGSKKARFTRDEIRTLVRNVTSVLWSLYAAARVRADVARLLLQGVGGLTVTVRSSSSSSAAPSTPPFLAMLTYFYSLMPLELLHELGPVKDKQGSSQGLAAYPELLLLRKGSIKFVHLLFRKALLHAMGLELLRTSRANAGRWHYQPPKPIPTAAPVSSLAATTSSPLPGPFSVAVAADTFAAALQLLHDTVTNSPLCSLPAPMKNLLHFNAPSAQHALLKRANEYYEYDGALMLLLEQARDTRGGQTPGASLGEKRIISLLNLLQSVDPSLLRDRVGWPPSASVPSRARGNQFDEEEKKGDGGIAPGSLGLASMSRGLSGQRQTSGSSGIQTGDNALAISSLHDLFPSFSTDYLAACLSELNGDEEATTNAILQEKLPDYLQNILDKSRYRRGDHMDPAKLKKPAGGKLDSAPFSRQSSSGFSSGSGLLDIAVDDEDEAAASHTIDYNDEAGFEDFLRRTGRVSKEQLAAKKSTAAGLSLDSGSKGSLVNSFGDKSEAALLASKIQSSLTRFSADEDEYDDAFDEFESFAVDGHAATEIEDTAPSLYERQEPGPQGGDEDEPDGSYRSGKQQRGGASSQRSVRGGSAGRPASAAAAGGRGGKQSQDLHKAPIPRNFMPDLVSPAVASGPVDVREQWRRDEARRELFVATKKAQKAQTIAPSKRTPEQQNDYEYGIQQRLIEDLDTATSRQTPANKEKVHQQQRQQPQQQPQQLQPAQQAGGSVSQQKWQRSQQHGGHAGGEPAPARGGFSIRGGRGGGRGGSALSASAAEFTPSAAPSAAARPHSAHPTASSGAEYVPAHWDDGDDDAQDDDDGSGDGDAPQQQGGGGSAAGAPGDQGGRAHKGQQRQSMDARQKKRKEKNKGIVGNHNRKAGAARKQGMSFH